VGIWNDEPSRYRRETELGPAEIRNDVLNDMSSSIISHHDELP